MNKKKVLIFIKVPPPNTGATYMNLCVRDSAMLRDNYNIEILEISYSKTVKDLGGKSIRKLYVFLMTMIRLLNILLVKKPELIYFQISPLGIAFLRDLFYVSLIKIFNKRILFHLHGKGIRRLSERNSFYKFLYRFCFKNENVICLSELLVYDIELVYSGRPYILNNCIKSDNTLNISVSIQKPPTLAFISNFHESKGVYDFVKVVGLLSKKFPKIKGIMIGNEGRVTFDKLKYYINKHNVNENIELLGPVYGRRKFDILLSSDVLVHPTYNDSWGLVILEAMMCSLPIVSTIEGSIPIMVKDNFNGFLLNKGDVTSMAQRIDEIVSNPELKNRLGRNSIKLFNQQFTYESFENNLVDILKSILN